MGKKDKKNKGNAADAAISSVAESLGTLATGDETAGKLIGAIAGPLLSAGLSSMMQPTDPQAKQKTKATPSNTQLQPATTPYTLHLRVDSAQYLRFATSTKAFCKVYIGNTLLGAAGAAGHREYTTRTCESANPAIAQWNQSVEIPVQHKQEVLSFCVYSDHANAPCSCIGSCGVQLRTLMDGQSVQQDHTLRLGAEQAGTIRLHMTLTQSALHHAYSEPQMHMQAGMQPQQPGGYLPQVAPPSYSTPMGSMQPPPAHLVRLNVLSAQNSMLGSAFQAFCQLFVGSAAIGNGNDHRKFVVPHQALSGPNSVQWNHAVEIPLVHHNEVLSVCMYAKQAQGSPSVGTCVIGFNTPVLSSGHLDDRSYSLLLGGKVVGEIRLLIQVISTDQHGPAKAASCGQTGSWVDLNGQPQQASWQAGCGGPQQQPFYPQMQQQAPMGNPMPPNQAQWQGQQPQQPQQQWQGQPPQHQQSQQPPQQQWQEPTRPSDSHQQQWQGPPPQASTPQQQYPPAPEQAQWQQQQSQAPPQTQQQYAPTQNQPALDLVQSQEQKHQQWHQQPAPGPEPAVVVVTPQEQIPPPQSSQWPQDPQGVGNQYEYPIATPLETKAAVFEPRSSNNNDLVGSLSSDEEDSSSDQDEQDQSSGEAGYSSDEVDANREHKLLLRLEKTQLELQAIQARRQQRGQRGRHSGSKSSSRSHAAPSRDAAAELRAVSQANEELDAAFMRAAIEQRGRNMALALI